MSSSSDRTVRPSAARRSRRAALGELLPPRGERRRASGERSPSRPDAREQRAIDLELPLPRRATARATSPRSRRPSRPSAPAVAPTRRSATRRSWSPSGSRAPRGLARAVDRASRAASRARPGSRTGALLYGHERKPALHAPFTPSSRAFRRPRARMRRPCGRSPPSTSARTASSCSSRTSRTTASLEVLLREKAMVRLGSETLARAGSRPRRSRRAPRRSSTSSSSPAAPAPRSSGPSRPAPCGRRPTRTSSSRPSRSGPGVNVDVISGEEEARLINLAVRSEFPARQDPLFLIDIGGGSTEFVISDGSRVLLTESLPARRRAARRPVRAQRPAVRQGPAGHEEGDPRRGQARGRGRPQDGLQDVRRLLRHDPVAVARPRGRGPRPGAEPDGPPDADPRAA